jgi:hypothetical protein
MKADALMRFILSGNRAVAQPWRREPLFVPLSSRSRLRPSAAHLPNLDRCPCPRHDRGAPPHHSMRRKGPHYITADRWLVSSPLTRPRFLIQRLTVAVRPLRSEQGEARCTPANMRGCGRISRP